MKNLRSFCWSPTTFDYLQYQIPICCDAIFFLRFSTLNLESMLLHILSIFAVIAMTTTVFCRCKPIYEHIVNTSAIHAQRNSHRFAADVYFIVIQLIQKLNVSTHRRRRQEQGEEKKSRTCRGKGKHYSVFTYTHFILFCSFYLQYVATVVVYLFIFSAADSKALNWERQSLNLWLCWLASWSTPSGWYRSNGRQSVRRRYAIHMYSVNSFIYFLSHFR